MSGSERFALDVTEASQYIGMSRAWLYASDIPRVKLGRSVKFLREDLEKYLRDRRTHGHAA
jgi:predicted DNA-binding transcriptional regulator AlpA